MNITLTNLCVFLPLIASVIYAKGKISIDDLNAAFPERASSSSCVGHGDECVTNAQALVAINKALSKYKIKRRGEAVAIVALEAFESGSWKYNTNHFPGRPGQGTRAMLMFNFINEYARSLHPKEVAQLTGSSTSVPTDPNMMNQVRSTVLGDDDSFGSGFWYLTTKASDYHNNENKLRDGDLSDFKTYVVEGVGASWDEGRATIWAAVNSAFPRKI